jgi:hypothetical protein
MHGPRSSQPDDATSRTRPARRFPQRQGQRAVRDRPACQRTVADNQMDQERRGGFTDLICRTPQRPFRQEKKYTGLLIASFFKLAAAATLC